ncbi:uncharacterized protein LOC122254400 [Penaeus japonicus]|uniref:uncharacterized protein LOC122254400 n=1 Tax=Penaeus japonicus TaxID=27405 RepID=UPI001C7154BC|nr:uncharacterized protein LOC122254400 [Penaeus japonicus]
MQGTGPATLRARVRGLRARIKGSRYCLPFSLIVFTILDLLVFHSGAFSGLFRSRSTRGSNDDESYLINTPGCVIQNFDVLSPQFAKLRKEYPMSFKCGDKRDLTESAGLKLFMFKERATEYKVKPSDLECNYRRVIPRTDKEGFINVRSTLGDPVPITDTETHIDEDGILATCFEASDNNTPIYYNVHYFVQPQKAQVKVENFKKLHGDRSAQPDKLSVLVLGIDSLSRFNMIRHMTETYRYAMQELDALDFRGYNKQGANTRPNTIAFLLGMTRDKFDATEFDEKDRGGFRSEFPVIWKDFANEGYVTAFGDDVAGSQFFNPHDVEYFQRGAFTVSQRHIAHFIPNLGFSYAPCQGNKMSASVIYDYALDVARSVKDAPYFGFYWTCAITHDMLMMTRVIDQPVKTLLQTLNEEGILNHTVLFLVSDHGARYGKLRNTYLGNLEVNLPAFMAIFPPWFKTLYPRPWKNLVTNTRRLVSNFDFHQTLHDLASRDYILNKIRPVEANHGQSLFREVPETRTCADVSIPLHLCACESYDDVSVDDPLVEAAAKFTVDYLNEGLTNFPDCVQLQFDKVLSARMSSGNNVTRPNAAKQLVTVYLLVLQTKPASATLESLVRSAAGELSVVGEVQRTNRYGNQSHCIDDDIYRQYCFCRDQLPQQ